MGANQSQPEQGYNATLSENVELSSQWPQAGDQMSHSSQLQSKARLNSATVVRVREVGDAGAGGGEAPPEIPASRMDENDAPNDADAEEPPVSYVPAQTMPENIEGAASDILGDDSLDVGYELRPSQSKLQKFRDRIVSLFDVVLRPMNNRKAARIGSNVRRPFIVRRAAARDPDGPDQDMPVGDDVAEVSTPLKQTISEPYCHMEDKIDSETLAIDSTESNARVIQVKQRPHSSDAATGEAHVTAKRLSIPSQRRSPENKILPSVANANCSKKQWDSKHRFQMSKTKLKPLPIRMARDGDSWEVESTDTPVKPPPRSLSRFAEHKTIDHGQLSDMMSIIQSQRDEAQDGTNPASPNRPLDERLESKMDEASERRRRFLEAKKERARSKRKLDKAKKLAEEIQEHSSILDDKLTLKQHRALRRRQSLKEERKQHCGAEMERAKSVMSNLKASQAALGKKVEAKLECAEDRRENVIEERKQKAHSVVERAESVRQKFAAYR